MKANERLAASQTAHSLGSCSVSENKRREKGSYTGSCTASCARGRRQLHGQPGSAYSPLPLTLPFRSPNLKQLRKARSRLYRSRCFHVRFQRFFKVHQSVQVSHTFGFLRGFFQAFPTRDSNLCTSWCAASASTRYHHECCV